MSILKTVGYEFKDGNAKYIYRYKQHEFVGEATCHEDDKDFEARMVGLDLAESRAYLQFLRVRREELLVRYETLKGFYQHLTNDNSFDIESSYAAKMRKEIQETYADLQDCRNGIKFLPRAMDSKIKNREDLYQKLRAKRKADEGE